MTEVQATYRQVFAVAPFRVLLASRTLATGAGTLRIVALSLLVFSETRSPLLSAVAFGVGFFPQALGGTVLASLADRWPPRTMITMGLLLECALAMVLALGRLPVGYMLALVALVATFTPIFSGATSRVLAEKLTGDVYVLGRSLLNIASGAAQLVGMAFGGLAVAAVGARHAIIISAGCQLAAALIVRFGLAPFHQAGHLEKRSVLAQSWETNRLLFRDRWVRRLLLIQWLPPAFVVGAEASVVAYAAARGFSPSIAGVLLACAPGGMLLGDLIVGRFVRPHVRRKLVAPLIALLGTPLILLAADPPLTLVFGLLALSAGGFAFLLGLQQAFLDAVPAVHRGHAFTVQATGLMTLQGLGPVAVGTVAQLAGVRLAMIVAGSGALACAAAWAIVSGAWRRPPARALPDLPDGALTDGVIDVRPLGPSDVDDYLALEQQPDVARYRFGEPITPETATERCATAQARWAAGAMAECVIIDTATRSFAGTIQLVNRDPATKTMMLGYALRPQLRGKGLATRAVTLLSDWAFSIGARRVIAGTVPENDKSRAVLQRAGFTLDAVYEAALPGPDGTLIDNIQLVRSARVHQ